MVKVVVVGSIALDDVKTPFGSVENALGGSAVFASLACSLYSKAGIVGVVGKDFPEKHLKLLESKGISLEGLEVSRAGKTFHWKGEYGLDVNTAKTIFTELNVFEKFNPVLPEEFKEADFLFLGNINPELQLNVLKQMKKRPRLVVADTMNLWIEKKIGQIVKVEPGSEMKMAISLAKRHNLKIALIDQHIAVTLGRFSQTITWKEKWNFAVDLILGIIIPKRQMKRFNLTVNDLTKVPDSRTISKILEFTKKRYPNFYNVLVHERNIVMANNLSHLMKENGSETILAVVGAGHQEEMMEMIKMKIK